MAISIAMLIYQGVVYMELPYTGGKDPFKVLKLRISVLMGPQLTDQENHNVDLSKRDRHIHHI